jgi:hypothetical protein
MNQKKEVHMINFINDALYSFRGVFSRTRTWILFSMVILGFIGAPEMIGVTSFYRFWGLGERFYISLCNFFRSSAWSLEALIGLWTTFVLAQNKSVMIQKRAVIQGDHTNTPKDGRRMPGVVALHQDSETQSKASFFRGHFWGAICLVVGSMVAPFGLPLDLKIHQGFVHIGKHQSAEDSKETLGTRIVQMALEFAVRHNLPCVLVLDAFFSNRSCLQSGRFHLVYCSSTAVSHVDYSCQKKLCRLL